MPTSDVCRFKITLRYVDPPVWRCIEVPDRVTLFGLHIAIQSAMGWRDNHLHVFRFRSIGDRVVEAGIPDEFTVKSRIPGWAIAASAMFHGPGAQAEYEYDFGDGWVHDVVLEAIVPREPKTKYPRCLAGARACPPEDCGGPPGYEKLLRVLGDAGDPEHQDMILWIGRRFDPEEFDPAAVRFTNPNLRLARWKRGM